MTAATRLSTLALQFADEGGWLSSACRLRG